MRLQIMSLSKLSFQTGYSHTNGIEGYRMEDYKTVKNETLTLFPSLSIILNI